MKPYDQIEYMHKWWDQRKSGNGIIREVHPNRVTIIDKEDLSFLFDIPLSQIVTVNGKMYRRESK